MRLGIFSTLCFFLSLLTVRAQEKDDVDLKTQQQVTFRNGSMELLDAYERETVKLTNNDAIIFKVLQGKVVDDNHSCGILGVRSVEIKTQSGAVEVSAQQFSEFVVASNYYTKFRDSWDHMRIKKEKLFVYEFGEKKLSQFSIRGNRDELIMTLGTADPNNKKEYTIFVTKDLRVMASFTDSANAVQKFIDTHNFGECM